MVAIVEVSSGEVEGQGGDMIRREGGRGGRQGWVRDGTGREWDGGPHWGWLGPGREEKGQEGDRIRREGGRGG